MKKVKCWRCDRPAVFSGLHFVIPIVRNDRFIEVIASMPICKKCQKSLSDWCKNG